MSFVNKAQVASQLFIPFFQGGLVFVCGSRDGLMTVTGRKHNTDDIIATVLAVEPMKFIYRGRIAVFSIRVLRDERICVVAEQRPDCSEEEVSFQDMSRWGTIRKWRHTKMTQNWPPPPTPLSFKSNQAFCVWVSSVEHLCSRLVDQIRSAASRFMASRS